MRFLSVTALMKSSTKRSNTYRGLSSAAVLAARAALPPRRFFAGVEARVGGWSSPAGSAAALCCGSSAARTSTASPRTWPSASATWPAKRFSIHSRAKSLGTPMTKAPSSRPRGRVRSNQNWKADSLRLPRRCFLASSQMSVSWSSVAAPSLSSPGMRRRTGDARDRQSEDALEEAQTLLAQGSLAVAQRVYQPHVLQYNELPKGRRRGDAELLGDRCGPRGTKLHEQDEDLRLAVGELDLGRRRRRRLLRCVRRHLDGEDGAAAEIVLDRQHSSQELQLSL